MYSLSYATVRFENTLHDKLIEIRVDVESGPIRTHRQVIHTHIHLFEFLLLEAAQVPIAQIRIDQAHFIRVHEMYTFVLLMQFQLDS